MERRAISFKDLSMYIILSVLTVVTYLLYYGKITVTQNEIKIAGALYIVGFLLGLRIVKNRTGSYASLMTFFWVSFFLFHGSQVVLNILGLGDYKTVNLFDLYSLKRIIEATYYSTICEFLFCFGILLNTKTHSHKSNVDLNMYFAVIKNCAKIFVTVSAVPFVYYVFRILRTGVSEGYSAINDFSNYGSATFMKIVILFVDAFIIGAFFLMASSYSNKKVYFATMSVVMLYCIILLALGERTEPTSLIILILWLDNNMCLISGNVAGARRKRIWASVVLALLILVFPSIMSLRNEGIITLSALVSEIRDNGIIESVKESFSGMGYSMLPLIEVRRLVEGGEPLRKGLTYLASFTNVVPYLGIAKNYGNLSTWLMNRLNLGYGPGFSMAAEAYLNFKDFPIPMVIYGYFISKILMWKNTEFDIRKLIRGMAFIITCLTLPRRELCSRIRDIAYLVILLPMVIDFIYNRRVAEENQKNNHFYS